MKKIQEIRKHLEINGSGLLSSSWQKVRGVRVKRLFRSPWNYYQFLTASAVCHFIIMTIWLISSIEPPKKAEAPSIEVDLVDISTLTAGSVARKKSKVNPKLLPQLPKRFSLEDEDKKKIQLSKSEMDHPTNKTDPLAEEALKKKVQKKRAIV